MLTVWDVSNHPGPWRLAFTLSVMKSQQGYEQAGERAGLCWGHCAGCLSDHGLQGDKRKIRRDV